MSRVRLAALAVCAVILATGLAAAAQPDPPPRERPGRSGFVASAHLSTFGPSTALEAAADQYAADVALVRATMQRDELLRQAAELERLEAEAESQARDISRAPAPAATTSGCGYEGLIRSYFGDAGDWAVSIAMRESRCTPGAKSPTSCWGLFQLCVPLHMGIFRYVCPELSAQVGNDVALDPECNVRAAKHLYDGSGTRPWAL